MSKNFKKFRDGLVVMSSDNCKGCVELKNKLNKLDIDYTVLDVWEDKNEIPNGLLKMGLPQAYYNGNYLFVGSPKKIEDLEKILAKLTKKQERIS